MVDIGLPATGAAVRGTDDDVGVAIAVHVPSPRHRVAEAVIVTFAGGGEGGRGVEAGAAAVVDIGLALVVAAGVAIGPHDDVSVAVAVDVPGPSHRVAEMVPRAFAGGGEGGGGTQAGAGAVVDVGPPLAVAVIGPHDDVGVAVAVDVPGSGYRPAEVVEVGFAGVGPAGGGGQGVNRERVDSAGVLHRDADGSPIPAGEGEVGRQLPPAGVIGVQLAVAQHGDALAGGEIDTLAIVAEDGYEVAAEGQVKTQGRTVLSPWRRGGDGEALLQAPLVVDVPFADGAPAVFQPVAGGRQFGGGHRLHGPGVTVGGQGQAPVPGLTPPLSREGWGRDIDPIVPGWTARSQAHAAGLEGDVQLVGQVVAAVDGRLGPFSRPQMVHLLAQLFLHRCPPLDGSARGQIVTRWLLGQLVPLRPGDGSWLVGRDVLAGPVAG